MRRSRLFEEILNPSSENDSDLLEQPLESKSKPPVWLVESRLFEQILREVNGQSIPTNAMTDYKKQGYTLEQLTKTIDEKLGQLSMDIQEYQLKDDVEKTDYESSMFRKDYENIYEGKVFNTPLSVQAKMGEGQGNKLYKKEDKGTRTKMLYSIKYVLEDPIAIIWQPVRKEDVEREKQNAFDNKRTVRHLKGKLVFLKSFDFKTLGKKVVNTATIEIDNMRAVISSSPRNIKKTLDQQIFDSAQVVYIKK
jgi:hypothetical protein